MTVVLTGAAAFLNATVAEPPDGVAAGDWDGDGLTDLAVTSRSRDTISVYLSARARTLALPVTVHAGSGLGQSYVTAEDLGGDLDADLVVTCCDDGAVVFMIRNGAAGYAVMRDTAAGARSGLHPVAADGLDRDARANRPAVTGGDPHAHTSANTRVRARAFAPDNRKPEPDASIVAVRDLTHSGSSSVGSARATEVVAGPPVTTLPDEWYVPCPPPCGAGTISPREAR